MTRLQKVLKYRAQVRRIKPKILLTKPLEELIKDCVEPDDKNLEDVPDFMKVNND